MSDFVERATAFRQRMHITETIARLSVAPMIIEDSLDEETIVAIASLFDPWAEDVNVEVGDLFCWDETVVECLQAHTTQSDWTPDLTPALWKIHRQTTGDTPDDWVAPTGSQDAYNTGDRVTFEGSVYESLIDANIWSPLAYPQGWELV